MTDHKPLKVASGGLASHDPTTDTQHLRATAFANVAALPAAAANERRIVWVQSTDAGARLCVSNGANWVYADSQGTTAID